MCRVLKENRIFAGVWYGCAKPDMSLFLKPVATSLKKLYLEGKPSTIFLYYCEVQCHMLVLQDLLGLLNCDRYRILLLTVYTSIVHV